MCSPNHNALLSYGLKVPAPSPYFSALSPTTSQLSALEFQRSHLCDYSTRIQLSLRGYTHALATGLSPYQAAAYLADPYTQTYFYKTDPRARFVQEEPKPSHSYIGLIAMAILSSKEKKLVLSDIYQWILDNYPYFRTRGPGWRNSIRHNLSLNDCFIKSGRSANGKGHYWAVHPANVDDFTRGDFRRRRAQRKVRKHMGLSVPDDDDDSPSPSPNPSSWSHGSNHATPPKYRDDVMDDGAMEDRNQNEPASANYCSPPDVTTVGDGCQKLLQQSRVGFLPLVGRNTNVNAEGVEAVHSGVKKRLFDMDSLLAPDLPVVVLPKVRLLSNATTSGLPSQTVHSKSNDVHLSTDYNNGAGAIGNPCDIHSQVAVHNSNIHASQEDSSESDIDIETDDVGETDMMHPRHLQFQQPHVSTGNNHPRENHDNEVVMCPDDEIDAKSDDSNDTFVQNGFKSKASNLKNLTTSSASISPPARPLSASALDLSPSSANSSLPTTPGSSPALSSLSREGGGGGCMRWVPPGLDLSLHRYSAFHAANIEGLRTTLSHAAPPFLHPMVQAARFSMAMATNAASTTADVSSHHFSGFADSCSDRA